MTPEQLEMLLNYISNEITIAGLRNAGSIIPESYIRERHKLKDKLRASVLQSSLSHKGQIK